MSLSPSQSVQRKQKLALTPQMRMVVDFLSRDSASIAAEIFRLGRTNASLALAAAPEGEARTAGLYEYAATWIASEFSGAEQGVALHFLEALEPWGWLGAPLSDICVAAGVSEAAGLAMLRRLQRIEPPGLFARSLTECLSLQVRSEGPPDPLMGRVLENLPRLEQGGPEHMAAICNCSLSELSARLARLRQLDPKPGLSFDAAPHVPTRVPDLILKTQAAGWHVDLHPDALPRFARLPTLDRAAEKEADRLEKALDARNRTLLAIARRLLAHQHDYLCGKAALRPLTMLELARDTGRHKSTISRVLQWATIETARGVEPLRSYLGTKLRGTEVSPDHLVDAIASLVASEDPAHPLTDDELARRLGGQGLAVARRTVAKYRNIAKIPPARRRVRPVTARPADQGDRENHR